MSNRDNPRGPWYGGLVGVPVLLGLAVVIGKIMEPMFM